MAARVKGINKIVYTLTVLLFFGCTGTSTNKNPEANRVELPKWTWPILEAPAFKEKYTFDFSINPFYLQADFDNDGSLDLAVLVKEKTSGKPGLTLLKNGDLQPEIFGAGNYTPFGKDDWSWLKTWKTELVLPAGAGNKAGGATLILFPKDVDQPAPWLFWNGKDWQWKVD